MWFGQRGQGGLHGHLLGWRSLGRWRGARPQPVSTGARHAHDSSLQCTQVGCRGLASLSGLLASRTGGRSRPPGATAFAALGRARPWGTHHARTCCCSEGSALAALSSSLKLLGLRGLALALRGQGIRTLQSTGPQHPCLLLGQRKGVAVAVAHPQQPLLREERGGGGGVSGRRGGCCDAQASSVESRRGQCQHPVQVLVCLSLDQLSGLAAVLCFELQLSRHSGRDARHHQASFAGQVPK